MPLGEPNWVGSLTGAEMLRQTTARAGLPSARRLLMVSAMIVVGLGGSLTAPGQAHADEEPEYPVTNTSEQEPDGVYFRRQPDWSTGDETDGYGVFAGERVRLKCWSRGSDVPRTDGGSNKVWYSVENVSRPRVSGRDNSGWLNAHFIDDGTEPNQTVEDVPACESSSEPLQGGDAGPLQGSDSRSGGELNGVQNNADTCPWVYIIVIPGSNETSELKKLNEDVGKLADISKEIRRDSDASIEVHVISYPAVLVPLIKGSTDTYFSSKNKGYNATWNVIDGYHKKCSASSFVLVGYSQGAHIAGDIAETMRDENAPAPLTQLRSAKLLADPARDAEYSPLVGMSPGGAGGMVGGINVKGVHFAGNRGLGSLTDRVTEYCTAGDGVCDFSGANLTLGIASGKHTEYGSATVEGSDQTFIERIRADIINDISLMNKPTF